MSGKPYWQVTFSFARFNAKHISQHADKSDARVAVYDALEKGLWITDPKKKGKETYWSPNSIAKVDVEVVEPESLGGGNGDS